MRQLMFRAWKKKEKAWLFGYEIPSLGGFSLIGETVLLGELNSVPLEDWNDIEIMQYTNVKDKNEKEIYEGDILKYSLGNGEYWNAEVIWYHDRWQHRNKADIKQDIDMFKDEVIGNIYENPELLK